MWSVVIFASSRSDCSHSAAVPEAGEADIDDFGPEEDVDEESTLPGTAPQLPPLPDPATTEKFRMCKCIASDCGDSRFASPFH